MLQIILFLSLIAVSTASCNRTCGTTIVPYPFGFSLSCAIQLSCDSSSNFSFHGFPLLNFTTNNTFVLKLAANCSRPVTSASVFFSKNYALTARNGLLLRNCSKNATSPCTLPTAAVSQKLHSSNCSSKEDNLQCLFNNSAGNLYLTKDNLVNKSFCGDGDLFSSVLYEQILGLTLGIVEIGWWMTGPCNCVANATCRRVASDQVKDGYWCRCNEGLVGDGYADGDGCRRVETCAADCEKDLDKRHARARSIIQGIAGGTSILVCLVLFCLVCCRHLKRNSSAY